MGKKLMKQLIISFHFGIPNARTTLTGKFISSLINFTCVDDG